MMSTYCVLGSLPGVGRGNSLQGELHKERNSGCMKSVSVYRYTHTRTYSHPFPSTKQTIIPIFSRCPGSQFPAYRIAMSSNLGLRRRGVSGLVCIKHEEVVLKAVLSEAGSGNNAVGFGA